MVLYFLDQPDVYPFTTAQKVTGYMVLARVEWELGSPRAADYLEKCLDCSKNITSSQEARISVLRFAAVVYYKPEPEGTGPFRCLRGIVMRNCRLAESNRLSE